MKSFSISDEQIARIIGAVFADELSRGFNRHVDFLTIAGWTGATAFGADGVGLRKKETAACLRSAGLFFGLPERFFQDRTMERFEDAATAIGEAISKKLEYFTFRSAARDDGSAVRRHRADEIYHDAAAAANLLYGRRRLLSFVSPHSLMGFVLTVLTPNLQSIESIDARGMTPENLSEALRYGDVLVATPTLWRYMMRESLASPDNTMAVAFGEAMAPDLAADMRKAGFGVLREIYGSTETGLMGWRDSPTEPFVLFDHWRQENGEPVRLLPDGKVRTSPAMDFIEWRSARAFRLAGRRDGAVQVGAVNVQPEDVARRLRQHPAVADCSVSVNDRGDGARRLVAHISLKKGRSPDERTARDIDAWCRTSLRQQERPRIYHFHDRLAQDKKNAG
ncbi:MAG: hypothetical protein AAFW81_07315 [Pseudomonadota bacterium]